MMIDGEKYLKNFIQTIKDGYDVQILQYESNWFLIVPNSKFQEDNGQNPYLSIVLDHELNFGGY